MTYYFPVYVVEPFEYEKNEDLVSTGKTKIKDIWLIGDITTGFDQQTKRAQMTILECGPIENLMKRHKRLWFFWQYQTEVFWAKDIQDAEIKRVTEGDMKGYIIITMPIENISFMRIDKLV